MNKDYKIIKRLKNCSPCHAHCILITVAAVWAFPCKLSMRICNYLYFPIITALTVNIGIYFTDRRAGIIFSVFLLVYAVYVFTVYMLNRPALTKEMRLISPRKNLSSHSIKNSASFSLCRRSFEIMGKMLKIVLW